MAGKVHDLRLGMNIQEHDIVIKLKHVEKWLKAKDQVRITIILKGREKSRPDSAVEFLLKIADRIKELGTIVNPPNPGNLSIMINPKK